MIGADQMRDRVVWRRKLGDTVIPGEPNLADPVTVRARVITSTRDVAQDVVATETIWVDSGCEVKPGDWLNGGEVGAVSVVKDLHGNAIRRVASILR